MPLCTYIHITVKRTLFCIQLYTNQKLQIQSTLTICHLVLLFFAIASQRYWYPKFITHLKSPILQLRIQQNFISWASENSSSCLFTQSQSPTFNHHPKTMTQSPLSLFSNLTWLVLLLQSVKTITIFWPIQCLLIMQLVFCRLNIMHKSLLDYFFYFNNFYFN